MLYDKSLTMPWENYLRQDRSFSISASVKTESIRDFRYASMKLKDAIVDRFRSSTGKRPDSNNKFEEAAIFLYWKDNNCTVYLDTSGVSLHKRGYRMESGLAPMQETLAAGLVLASKWKPDTLFINPMCGAGTLAIEAAMISANIPPGSIRKNWAFKHLPQYDYKLLRQVKKEIVSTELSSDGPLIYASDHNRKILAFARQNAQRMGVDKYINFTLNDFKESEISPDEGLVILNPEYGERTGDEEELLAVYRDIGDFFKQKCNGKTGAIFSTSKTLLKAVGLRAKSRLEFFTGPLNAKFHLYDLYAGTLKKK